MRKRPLSYTLGVLTLAMMMSLTGCNDDEDTTTESTEVVEEVTEESSETSKKSTTENAGKKSTTEESSKKTTEEDSAGKTTETSSNKQTTTQGTTQQVTTQSATTQNTSSNTTQVSAQSTTQTTTPQTTSTNTSTNTSSQETSSPATTHTHNWVPITEQVYCPEEVRYEDVEVDDYQVHTCCNGCGFDFTANGGVSKYYDDPQYGGCPVCGSGGYSDRQILVGQKPFDDGEYKNVEVVDQPAYDEKVIDHYECSCGATRKP